MSKEYSNVFQGIGCFKGECHIDVDTSVPPYVAPSRSVPLALREPLKKELDNMEKNGITKALEYDETSRWVNQFVCVSKANGKIRFCLDPAKLNEAIVRPYHYTPTLDDILPKLNGAKFFQYFRCEVRILEHKIG